MRFVRTQRIMRGVKRPHTVRDVGIVVFGGMLASSAQADPADDALAKLSDLSRQTEQTTEAMHSAQLDFDKKLAAQQEAETKHGADLATANAARSN